GLAAATGKTGLLVGCVGENATRPGREATNSVALLHQGKVLTTRIKTLLPTYDVFDEDRYFEPATENRPVEFQGRKIGLTICEDVWNDEDFWRDRRYRRNPAVELVEAGAKIVFNVSASPWHLGKNRTRFDMLHSLAVKTRAPLVYCNLVGGNDELVFDGCSLAFTACLAVAALGAEQVRGVSLPSQFSSQGSLDDARAIAERLGIRYDVISIQPPFEAVRNQLKAVFAGRSEDTTEENIQARLRGVTLMALSNKFGSLLLTTGNKSELAVGYCTLYGDMCGGLAVISDVPKTMIYRLSRWINRDK